MAKKKKPEKEKDYTEERVEEFLDDDGTKTDPDSQDDTGKETPAPPEKEPEKVEEEEPELDVEELKKSLVEEVKAEVATETKDSIIQALTGKKEQDIEDQTPWAKEGRTPRDYDEIATWAKDQAKKEWQEERTKEVEEQKEFEKQTEAELNKYWDGQLEEMHRDGRLPPVKDATNPDDLGLKARVSLFEAAMENKERNLELTYYKYYKKDKQPAGADAPVSAAKKSVSQGGEEEELSYEELHAAKELRDLIPTT